MSQIVKMWSVEYPQLSIYTQQILLMVAGPLAMGMFFKKDGRNYRIHWAIFPLWNDELDLSPKYAAIFEPLRDKNSHPLDIPLDLHEHYYLRDVEYINEQFGALINREIKLSDIIYFLYGEIDRVYYLNRFHESRTIIYELLLGIAVFLEDEDLKENIKSDINKVGDRWSRERFKNVHAKTYERWREELDLQFGDRESFMEKVRANASTPRIANLNRSVIIKDQEFEYQPYETPGRGWRRFLPKCWR